ncbi:MAG TPA: ATP-binding protein, partial [Polyangiaceae bacterium]
MDDVSWKVFEFYSDYLARKGVDPARLVEALPRGAALLSRERKWYDWDEHVVICERFGELCGGWDAAEAAAGEASLESWTKPLRALARNFASARHVYWLGAHLFAPYLYRHIRFAFEELARHHVRIAIALPAQYRPCELVFRMWRGAYRAGPRMLGLEDAQVDAEISAHHAVYSIWLPQNRSLTRRAAVAARSLVTRRTLVDEMSRQQALLRDNYEALARAYKESERNQRALVAAIPDVILRLSPNGDIVSIDGASDTVLRAHLSASIPSTFSAEIARQARLAVGGATGLKFEIDVPDGGMDRSYECRTVTMGSEGALAIVRDVTMQRRLEQQLRVAETLASLGTLAAGVAHEINNPLTYLFVNLERLQKGLGRGDLDAAEVSDVSRDLLDGAERIRDVVRGVKAFTRPDASPPTAVDVNRVVESALRVTEHRLRPRAVVTACLGEEILARASAGPLEQVLVNLLVNAAEALPADRGPQGHVSITTHRLPDGRVAIDVADDGPGIPKELRAKVFDPFFTTKAVGAGTGLGLAISHGIVTRFGGQIAVESDPSRGTTFRVILPAAAGSPDAPAPASPAAPILRKSAPRVLIVDDETAILRALRLMLRDYVVLTASGTAEALRIVAEEEIDAAVCDIAMPGTNGIDLARRFREMKPALASRIVFMTGNPATWADDLAGIPHAGCLEKPFTEQALR